MRPVLSFSLALAAVLAACATQRSGLDSESHFACDSDADCATHAPRIACVANLCVVAEGGTTDATVTQTGGAHGETGGTQGATGGARATGGQGGAGGGSGGMPVNQLDATLPPPDRSPPRPATDAGICTQCTNSLPPIDSLDCYCTQHGCDFTFARALANPRMSLVDKGCGRLMVWNWGGAGGGWMESFDPVTGMLIGAYEWGDVGSGDCVTPLNHEGAAGGREWYALSYGEDHCDSKLHCALAEPGDDGGSVLDPAPPCDVDALLHPCPTGQVEAALCTSCLAGCGGPELKCTLPCTSDRDCASGSAAPNCVNGACGLFCPF